MLCDTTTRAASAAWHDADGSRVVPKHLTKKNARDWSVRAKTPCPPAACANDGSPGYVSACTFTPHARGMLPQTREDMTGYATLFHSVGCKDTLHDALSARVGYTTR